MNQALKIAVLGGGSFGTAIANILAANGHETTLWMRSVEHANKCRQEKQNNRYLPGFDLDSRLLFSADLEASVKNAALIFISIPSNSFRQVTQDLIGKVSNGVGIISTA
jgi:glycerol-3-phosphate dehydrogenase (NAD(P)+)